MNRLGIPIQHLGSRRLRLHQVNRHGYTVGISEAPLRYPHPVDGRARVHGRAACHHIARVCVPLDAAVTSDVHLSR